MVFSLLSSIIAIFFINTPCVRWTRLYLNIENKSTEKYTTPQKKEFLEVQNKDLLDQVDVLKNTQKQNYKKDYIRQ